MDMIELLLDYSNETILAISVLTITTLGFKLMDCVGKKTMNKQVITEARQSLQNETDELLEGLEGIEINKIPRRVSEFGDVTDEKKEEIFKAYQIDAAQTAKVTNPIVAYVNYNDAIEIDDVTKECEVEERLLSGVPISVKSNINMKNYYTQYGLVKNLQELAKEDAIIIRVMKCHGALPFIRTNVPQSMLSFDSSNPIHGATLNPHNVKKTSGGSSSGEGSLIGQNKSIIGLGGDIGGSLRIPAMMCGIFSIKPTVNRVSSVGAKGPSKATFVLHSVLGPLANEAESLVRACQVLFSKPMWTLDPTCTPVPFNKEMFKSTQSLTIGWYHDDGFIPTTPAYKRAVDMALKALEGLGHKIVQFTPPDVYEALMEIYYPALMSNKRSVAEAFQGEPVDDIVKEFIMAARLPDFLLKLAIPFYSMKDKIKGDIIRAMTQYSDVKNLHEVALKKQKYIQKFTDEWNQLKLDACVFPGFGCNQVDVGKTNQLRDAFSYTALYNVNDYPVGVVPMTNVTEEDEEALRQLFHNSQNLHETNVLRYAMGNVGAPVGIQIAAKPFDDELILRLIQQLQPNYLDKLKNSL
ncbi:hypothetical protein SNEBB_005962 [Seison nebaliae]|nr:hypothetical protein SNEBB_005962 [Seison nebaliae]